MSPSSNSPAGVDHRTRQRLLEAAIRRLSAAGLTPGLLAAAVEEIGCSPQRAEVFFRRDEDLILALYARLAAELESRVLELPDGTVAQRFRAAMDAKFAIAEVHRPALAALLATLLDPRNELSVLHPQTQIIRDRVQGVFAAVTEGAVDRPAAGDTRVARLLYAAHLTLMLVWCQDRTADAAAARAALELTADLLEFAGPWLSDPAASAVIGRLDGIAGPLLQEADSPELDEQASAILRQLFAQRRLLPGHESCAADPCRQCLALHLPKVKHFLRAGQPLHLLLPGFPAKSPSRTKTLGPLPDRAEQLALEHLQALCEQLQALHAPGARLTICSDGHVFADLVGVADAEVTTYGQQIVEWIEQRKLTALDTFGTGDLYEQLDFEQVRIQLASEYGRALEEVERQCARLPHARSLFNGIHRFLFEEQLGLTPGESRTQVRRRTKQLACEVIRRSDAWGRLLADCFPTALRLSIHPQHPHSEKIGILLGEADDVWLTPWHAVAVRTSAGWQLMKRDAAETLGARLIEEHGQPSHFELD